MAQAKGILSQVLLDWETTFGSDPGAAAAYKMPFNTFGVKAERNMIEPQTITGRRDPVAPAFGNTSVGGPAVIPIDVNNIGWWLKALCGAPTTTGSDPYTHVYKPTNAAAGIPSMVMELGYSDITQFFKFNGCKVASLSMSVGGDGELTASVEILGSKETVSGTTYDASPTTMTFTRLGNFQAALEEGGASFSTATSLDFQIDNGLDGGSYAIGGGGVRAAIPEGLCKVTGTLTAFFEDLTLYNKAVNSTETSLKCTFTSGANSLEFLFNELNYKQGGPTIDGMGGVRIPLEFSAYFDDHADDAVAKITLINSTSSYA